MKISFSAVLLFSIILVIAGCGKEQVETEKKVVEKNKEAEVIELPFDTTLPGREGVENTIKAYNIAMRNALLADSYFKVLRKYATEKEAKRVYIDVEYDSQKGVAMRSWQRELIFDNISTSEGGATADTTETWEFEFVDLKTEEVVESMKKVRYKLKYTLEKKKDAWLVSKIRERETSVYTQTVEIPVKSVQ